MYFPKELWYIIKNYTFDYKKYWKIKFNKTLKLKILNEIREISSPLDPNIDTFGLDVVSITSIYFKRGDFSNRTQFWWFGWIPFTTCKKKNAYIRKMKRLKLMLM